MNEWCMYKALYYVLLYTQALHSHVGGVSPQPPPVCSVDELLWLIKLWRVGLVCLCGVNTCLHICPAAITTRSVPVSESHTLSSLSLFNILVLGQKRSSPPSRPFAEKHSLALTSPAVSLSRSQRVWPCFCIHCCVRRMKMRSLR